jgi:nickel-dependent lactate racemase
MSEDDKKIPSLVCAVGSETTALTDDDIRTQLTSFLEQLGPKEDVFLLPPDFTRFHSQSGKITTMIADHYGFLKKNTEEETKELPKLQIMPALGTHTPMTPEQIKTMFGEELAAMDPSPFLVHDWRNDVVTIGHAPEEMVGCLVVTIFLSALMIRSWSTTSYRYTVSAFKGQQSHPRNGKETMARSVK